MRLALLLMVVCLLPLSVFAEEEKLTITTYYPSPVGVYQELQTSKLAVGDVNNDGSIGAGDLSTVADDNAAVAGSLTVGNSAGSAVRLTVNGQIRACDSGGQCGNLAVDCDGTNCWAVYSD